MENFRHDGLNRSGQAAADRQMCSLPAIRRTFFAVFLLGTSASAATLTDSGKDPGAFGGFRFRLLCESNATYLLQRSTNLIDWTTFQRSISGGINRTILVSNF